MRELNLIVPGLATWRDNPHSEAIAMPGLDRLLARGRAVDGETSLAGSLCDAFGIARQQDNPLAPVCAAYDGLAAGEGYWLRADPVYLQVGMRGMTLLDAAHIGLDAEESRDLAASLAPLFESVGWRLYAPQPGRWYANPSQAVELSTTPLDQATSRLVNSTLPVGISAARIMRLVNDAQILLHDHPVNQAREARGQAPINSLWLWGGGERPEAMNPYRLVLSEQPEALALATYTQAANAPCPARLRPLPRVASLLVVLPEFPLDARAEQATRLDADWFQPLLRALRIGRIRRATLTLTGPEGSRVGLDIASAWKFWLK